MVETKTGPYNVIMISLDTVRRDHLGCYGYGKEVSPTLDGLARDGILFEDGVANCGWTLPQHVTMLTGVYPITHGLVYLKRKGVIPRKFKTLAEILQAAGYTTLGFCNQNGYGGGWRYGFHRGMNSFTNVFHYNNMMEKVVPHAMEYMTLLREKPFFMYIHTNDTHEPFAASEPYGSMWGSSYENRYEGEITYVDNYLGVILERLEELGLTDKTLVVATSDHGSEFKEHGFLEKKLNLYEEILQVPMLMRLPGVLPAGLRVAGQAQTVDLMTTILDICGFNAPEGIDGRSMLGRIRGDEQGPDVVYSHTLHETAYWYEHWSARSDNYKFIRTQPLKKPKTRKNLVADRFARLEEVATRKRGSWIELYDLKEDPAELENLASGRPKVVGEMERGIRKWVRSCGYSPLGGWP
jgi:arylsulfatase A-like enzyme